MKFYGNIQLARSLAASSVVVHHIMQEYDGPTTGQFGVDVFFVISGFLMAMLSDQRPEQFFLRRVVRIVPMYWACTLGLYLLFIVKPDLLGQKDI